MWCTRCFPVFLALVGLPATGSQPANPHAGKAARQVLDYLARLPERCQDRLIAGQHFGRDAEGFDELIAGLHQATGKWVGLAGADLGYPKTPPEKFPPRDLGKLTRVLIGYWRAGGLVTLSCHGKNPWTGGNAWDKEPRDLDELIRPGNPAHERYMKELDRVAGVLAELRDAGVVVLWRPFHEMNGAWFWWGHREGRRDGGQFVRLWRHMFRYFTETKKLNNLLWVYSASSSAHRRTSVMFYYPGDEYVDIVGVDGYSNEIAINGYNELAATGKPFALTEFGPHRDSRGTMDYARFLRTVERQFPQAVYFLIWSGGFSILNNKNAQALLDAPWVLTRDKLDWAYPGHRRWAQARPLAIRAVKLLTPHPAQWRRAEFRIDLQATFDSPFDQDEIAVDGIFTTPGGRKMTVPAFFYQRFEREINGDRVFLHEGAPPQWRVRFTPVAAGTYTVRIRARDRSGTVTSKPVTFTAAPGAGHGFLHVAKADPHYFAFEDGTPYFAIGENMAGGPLADYYLWIPHLAASGGNYGRLWIGNPDFGLEFGRMGDYRLDNAWKLDQVMELSEQHGIYQKLCIDWIRHITPRGQPRQRFDREDYAYSVSNGGPCANMRDFFELPEARRAFRNRLRYIVARWAYSPNVLAWELWNEINAVDKRVRGDHRLILDWNREMCRYLKSIDPWRHLTTNSLGSTAIWPEMWEMPENEFAQMHGYWYFSDEMRRNATDMAGFMIKWLDEVAHFGKPYLFAEFGIRRATAETRALCDADRDGVNLHNGLWAPLASGAAGTGMLWWWGNYVEPKNLYYHFLPVARFTQGIPWTTAGFEKATVTASRQDIRALGLRGGPLAILWIQNKAHTWWNVVFDRPIPAIRDAWVTVAGMKPGSYRVEYWDTYAGRISRAAELRTTANGLRIPLPTFATDLALKIIPAAPGVHTTGSMALPKGGRRLR